MTNTCAIIIPLYKAVLSPLETIALQQCRTILADYDLIFVKPDSLNLSSLNVELPSSSKAVSFNDDYFKSVYGYNNLMLSSEFYKQFLDYEYMLIYQLDAFVFKNELEKWCNSGYDYIGAPWLREEAFESSFKATKESIRSFFHRRFKIKDKHGMTDYGRQLFNTVGNGGLSLRRVRKFYQLCIDHQTLIDTYKNKTASTYNEDMFWSIEINRTTKRLVIPGYKQALLFSIETAPKRAMQLTKNKLPFGCHAWDKARDFWRPYFKEQGHLI